MARASDFPAASVRLVPWLDSVEKAGFDFFSFFLVEAGVTHPSDSDFPSILIGCEVHEYRRRIVDANVIGILPIEVSQEAMVPMNPFHGV